VSSEGQTGRMKVSRSSVGRVLADAVTNPALIRRSLAVSGATSMEARI
jgi:hypothetical protein